VDWLDAEKVYVQLCAVAVLGAIAWRVRHRRAIRRAERFRSGKPGATTFP